MDWNTAKQIISGISSYVPLIRRRFRKGTRGTDSARYCYSVWLRHLVSAAKNGLNSHPHKVAELGPGDSIGIGLAALLSGAEKYYALDVVEYANSERNIKVFNELVELFRNQASIPNEQEFPLIRPTLPDYAFPIDLFSPSSLEKLLSKSRLGRIRDSIADPKRAGSQIHYIVPWHSSQIIRPNSIDMIYSQAVLEHVEDLPPSYRAMYRWLVPGGFISHQIDFKCHWKAEEWNGHWVYSDRIWKWIQGKQPYLLNREPHSTHIRLLHQEGFRLVCDQIQRQESNLQREQLAPRFRGMPLDDLTISGTLIQACK